MKTFLAIILSTVALVSSAHAQYNAKIHSNGPDKLEAESGGEIEMKSGSTFDLRGTMDFASTSQPKAQGTIRASTAAAPAMATPDATYNPATLATQLNNLNTEIIHNRNAMLAYKLLVTPTPTPTATATP